MVERGERNMSLSNLGEFAKAFEMTASELLDLKTVNTKKIVDAAPAGLRWKRGYDLAVSTRTSADYTASFRVAFDRAGNLYIADGFREYEYAKKKGKRIEHKFFGVDHGVAGRDSIRPTGTRRNLTI